MFLFTGKAKSTKCDVIRGQIQRARHFMQKGEAMVLLPGNEKTVKRSLLWHQSHLAKHTKHKRTRQRKDCNQPVFKGLTTGWLPTTTMGKSGWASKLYSPYQSQAMARENRRVWITMERALHGVSGYELDPPPNAGLDHEWNQDLWTNTRLEHRHHLK